MMNRYADPKGFWEKRLSEHFDLTGVGYGPLGPFYNSRLYQARVNALEKAFQELSIKIEESDILEIGCGTGFFTKYCEEKNVNSYTGIDITEISTQSLANRFPQYRFMQADIGDEHLDLGREFDIILIADVLYHIVDDERFANAVKNIGKCLKPGGVIVASDLFSNITIDTKQHCKWRSISEYGDILAQNNIVIKKIEPIFVLLQPPPIFQGQPFLSQIYARVWHHVLLPLMNWSLCDRVFSSFLSMLDKKYFLHHSKMNAPTSKWLIAYKKNVP